MLGTKGIAKLTPYLTEKKVVNLEIVSPWQHRLRPRVWRTGQNLI